MINDNCYIYDLNVASKDTRGSFPRVVTAACIADVAVRFYAASTPTIDRRFDSTLYDLVGTPSLYSNIVHLIQTYVDNDIKNTWLK